MKVISKIILFISIFIFLYYTLSYLLLPKYNIKKFGLYKTSLYEILGEKPSSIDVIALGDSLVYSSIIPVELYENYGITAFDCAKPAITMPDAYDYLKIALESQKPTLVFLEANMFFRDTSKKPWYTEYLKVLQNALPLINYHNNWKSFLFNQDSLLSAEKGYKLNQNIKPSINKDYMQKSDDSYQIFPENLKIIKKMLKLLREYQVEVVILGLPSQHSWNYAKDQTIQKFVQDYNLTYLNLNNINLDIDWEHDTKDYGSHLNYYGAKKVTNYLGNYLKTNYQFSLKKDSTIVNIWENAYKIHKEKLKTY